MDWQMNGLLDQWTGRSMVEIDVLAKKKGNQLLVYLCTLADQLSA